MNKKRVILIVSTAVVVLLVLILRLIPESAQPYYLFFVALAVIADLILFGVLWRCPHCGRHLGRRIDGSAYCKYCGKKLDEE